MLLLLLLLLLLLRMLLHILELDRLLLEGSRHGEPLAEHNPTLGRPSGLGPDEPLHHCRMHPDFRGSRASASSANTAASSSSSSSSSSSGPDHGVLIDVGHGR